MNTTTHIHPQLSGPLAHAYIISGDDASQRRTLADRMARSLVCDAVSIARPCEGCAACEKANRGIHPDIQIVGPAEGKREIPVATVREMVADAPTLPNEAPAKVYIVEEADTLNPSAQNAFLKLLEEPPSFVTFLLLAENPLALLPTVRSRCVSLSLVPTDDVGGGVLDTSTQELVDGFRKAFTSGGMDLLQFCVALEKTERSTLVAFVETCHAELIAALGKRDSDRGELIRAVDLFDSLRTDLRFNVSTGHISGKILATLI
ncbi:MAG: hypothetical protein FWE08_07310 [Oscillospiraceae bacterium]|nr:hypothetical protein [Oscillospiraceae bacterium]